MIKDVNGRMLNNSEPAIVQKFLHKGGILQNLALPT